MNGYVNSSVPDINYARNLTGMQKAKVSSSQSIPFVAGKSLSNSHNIGIRIQQTKSLILKNQANKKVKQRYKPLKETTGDDDYKYHRGYSSVSSSSSSRRSADNMCPVLKYKGRTKPNFDIRKNDEESTDSNETKKQSIEEIWANYMSEVEEKNIVPVKCTCFPVKKPSKSDGYEINYHRNSMRAKNEQPLIYLEAKKIVNDYSAALLTDSDDSVPTYESSTVQDYYETPNRSTKMARYFQRIKQLQTRLAK